MLFKFPCAVACTIRNIWLSFFLLFALHSNAQLIDNDTNTNQNLRLIHKNHFGLGVGGPGFYGGYYEHYFNHNWSFEVGLGSVLVLTGAYVEGRYYFGKKDKPYKYTPYIGVAGGAAMILGIDDAYVTPTFYAPVGFQIFNKRGSAFSFEVAYFRFDGEAFPMGSLRFRLKKRNIN